MIYYFSGTGNSYQVAKLLAYLTQDKMQDISTLKDYKHDDSVMGFVFPVHCYDVLDLMQDLFVYWQATRGGNGLRSHNYDKEQKANLWITICPEKITDKDREYKLTSMEDTRFLHCNIKTLNLIPSVVAYQHAKENNCDETVFHRGDIVTECAHSNVHIIKDKKFITHPVDEYILPGIARAHLLKACKALNIEIEERPFTVDELINADEVIVSSSGDLCIRATEFEGKAVGKKDSDTFDRLKEYIYQEWLECTKK